MKYTPITDFTVLRICGGLPLLVHRSVVHAGDSVLFSTALLDARGVVLAIDQGAVYPLRIQYTSKTGDSRIQAFTPNEFLTFQLLERPYAT